MKNFGEQLNALFTNTGIFLIRSYQKAVSPDHGVFSLYSGRVRCRFYPSCSEYALRSVRQYGLLKGSMASLKRVVRCGPWSEGGYDPVINNARILIP